MSCGTTMRKGNIKIIYELFVISWEVKTTLIIILVYFQTFPNLKWTKESKYKTHKMPTLRNSGYIWLLGSFYHIYFPVSVGEWKPNFDGH